MTDTPPVDTPDEEMPPGYDEVSVEIDDPTDERPGNEDDDGVRHFCVIPPGALGRPQDEFCGGCGNPWPCDDAQRLMALELPQVG